MSLPADSHVHSEWSWDAKHGSMQQSCARAVELGLPSVAFTEHVVAARPSYGDGFREPTELFADRDPDRGFRAAADPLALWTRS